MARTPNEKSFLLSIGLTALALFVVWSLVIPHLPKYVPTLNQSDDNRQLVMNFERSDPAPVVLAGTSLLYRLSPLYFSETPVNIALPGQSPVSSAEIAVAKPAETMVIEINILDRGRDTGLERFSERLLSPPLGLRALSFAYSPVRSFVSLAFGLDAKLTKREAGAATAALRLLDQGPAPLDSGETVSSAAVSLDKRPVSDTIALSARELREIADSFESRGGKAYYLLMPMHPLLASTNYEKRSQSAMAAADPKFSERLLTVDWGNELRWDPDGAHLDSRSAVLAARRLEQAIKAEREN
ncbi:hypothetical protein [Rhizobium sp. KDH_Rht_773_N]